jgi:hypothetical protein
LIGITLVAGCGPDLDGALAEGGGRIALDESFVYF